MSHSASPLPESSAAAAGVPIEPPPTEPPPTEPPRTPLRILRAVGPGLIVAGSIVGSGELIATTKTGAEAGFSLLWLIILGCVVKVFAQIELGRYAIVSGRTTLGALDEVPGPRFGRRGNWLVWYWLLMWLASISQLGGIVGGVGQALAISAPITEMGRDYNEAADRSHRLRFDQYALESSREGVPEISAEEYRAARAESEQLWREYRSRYDPAPSVAPRGGAVAEPDAVVAPPDAVVWAAVMAVITSVMLFLGRYGLIQSLSMVLVGLFTLLTVVNLFLLQDQSGWRISGSELFSGLSMRLPERSGGLNPVGTALATFGIIGVGAAELVAYPYWCLEKGYARFTGRDDGSAAWRERAAGWMRVMRVDAWGSMCVYTFSTVAFYLLGAAVLHRVGLNPEKSDMVRTLAVMFVPVFSDWAAAIFLFGAFAVLYSTFFVANAAHARVFSDALRVIGVIAEDEQTRQRWIRGLSGFFPLLCLFIYIAFPAPAQLVLISGITQGIMLPMLAGAALYFRYRRCVDALCPGRLWDLMLWISAAAMLVTGAWTVIDTLRENWN